MKKKVFFEVSTVLHPAHGAGWNVVLVFLGDGFLGGLIRKEVVPGKGGGADSAMRELDDE